jgi:hypothetical protein
MLEFSATKFRLNKFDFKFASIGLEISRSESHGSKRVTKSDIMAFEISF